MIHKDVEEGKVGKLLPQKRSTLRVQLCGTIPNLQSLINL